MIGPAAMALAAAGLGLASALPAAAPRAEAGAARLWFTDATTAAGLAFVHVNGFSGRRHLDETMGAGVCVFDFDNDGAPDIYLPQGAPTPGAPAGKAPATDALFRNDGRGRFTDVTRLAGLGDRGQGMGCVAGDIEGDGDLDLFLPQYGPDVLYRNNGDGTFTDITAEAGLVDDAWGSSAAFGDADGDGDLDLLVANYVDFRYDNHKFCGEPARNLQYYCSPKAYNGEPGRLWINDGRGRFRDGAAAAGVLNPRESKSLGVLWSDIDNDGDQDIYVANDSERNFLFRNEGKGRFKDITLMAGVGYSEAGVAQAGMGLDAGDYDNDGDMDLIVTNLSNETNELYRNGGRGVFTDTTYASGIGPPGLLMTGFGVAWLDADQDGDLDLMVANGHIIDNVHQLSDAVTYAQPNHLFENIGQGRFREVSGAAGPGLAPAEVSRGLAVGDLDADGDLDVVISNNHQRAVILRNETRGAGHWLQITLRGRAPNPFAVGARVELTAAGTRQVREVFTGRSYQSHSDMTLHFGLGAATAVESLVVRWPSGGRESFTVSGVDRRITLEQGRGEPVTPVTPAK